MKNLKKLLAGALAGLMALSLAGCGGAMSLEEQIAKCQENMNAVDSMDTKMNMVMDMSAGGVTVGVDMDMNMTYFKEPVRMKMEMSMLETGMEMYMVEEGQSVTVYADSGDGWVKQTMSMEEYKEEYQQAEVQDNLNVYLDNAAKYEQVGTEKIGGVDAVKVKGVIPADALSEVINASGMMNEESIGLTGELLESLFKDMDDMEVYFWFNPETLYPVKYEMDMTNLMSSLYENLFAMLGAEAEGVSVNVSKVLISMEISNINNATEFTIPEEALNAPEGEVNGTAA